MPEIPADHWLLNPNAASEKPSGDDPVLLILARYAENHALAKQGDDHAADRCVDIEEELSQVAATTLAGLRGQLGHMVMLAKQFRCGAVAAQHAAAIDRGIAEGVIPATLPALRHHLEYLGRLAEDIDESGTTWNLFCRIAEGFEALINSRFPDLPSAHRDNDEVEGADEQGEEEAPDPAEAERRLAKYPPITLDIDPGEDPEIVSLFQEYVEAERVHARLFALELEETEEEEAGHERVSKALEALGRTPSRSLMGAALKVFALQLFTSQATGASLYPVSTPPAWPDEELGIDTLSAGFVRDLRRLVPGLSPLIAPPAEEHGA